MKHWLQDIKGNNDMAIDFIEGELPKEHKVDFVPDKKERKSFTDTFQEHLGKLLSDHPIENIKKEFMNFDSGMRNFGQGAAHSFQGDIQNAIQSIPTPLLHALSPALTKVGRQSEWGHEEAPQPGISGRLGELAGHIAGMAGSGLALSPLRGISLIKGAMEAAPKLAPILGRALGAATYGAATAEPEKGLYEGLKAGGVSGITDVALKTPGLAKSILGAKKIFERETDKVLGSLKGNSKEEKITSELENGISENKKIAKSNNRELYKDFTDSARDVGARVIGLPNAQEVAKEFLYHRGTETLSKEQKQMLREYLMGTQSGLSFERAYERMKDYGRKSRSLKKTDANTSSMYAQLKDAINNDMALSADKSGYPQLHEKLKMASNDYRVNVLPYNQNPIRNILEGKRTERGISNSLVDPRGEYEKVIQDLSPELKKKLAYAHFSKEIKYNPSTGKYESTPGKISEIYNDLSEKQKQLLFDKTQREKLEKLLILSRHSNKGTGAIGIGHLGHAYKGMHFIPIGLQSRVTFGLATDPDFRAAYMASNPLEKNELTNAIKRGLRATTEPSRKIAVSASLGER